MLRSLNSCSVYQLLLTAVRWSNEITRDIGLFRLGGSVRHVYKPNILKGAVCKFLTLLKHKNTMCLQTFKKHAKLTYVKAMLQSVILL